MTNLLNPLHLIFYLFALIAVISAVSVITVRNPVRSVLSLVVTFFSMSGIWMILHAEFLSLILLLVYVGAVMTLFLFVVMMLNIDSESRLSGFVRYFPFVMIVAVLITGLTIATLKPQYFDVAPTASTIVNHANESNIQQLGNVLYTDYAYPFEIAGVILLAAIIAAIMLTHRPPHKRKIQNVAKQISVRPEDRVKLIKMSSEPKRKNAP